MVQYSFENGNSMFELGVPLKQNSTLYRTYHGTAEEEDRDAKEEDCEAEKKDKDAEKKDSDADEKDLLQ